VQAPTASNQGAAYIYVATPVTVNMLIGDIHASKLVNPSHIGALNAQSAVPVTATNFRAMLLSAEESRRPIAA
jgi:hypothetical protein